MLPDSTTAPPAAVSLRSAFWYWLKLGCVSFGGPAGQIAMMHAELVEKRRWISEQRFLHALNYCMLLPGPEATQLAIYIGWLMHRTRGGIVAGLLFLLPSLLLLIALSWLYLAYGHVSAIAGILYGVKPAVVAIVVAAGWRLARRTLRSPGLTAIAAAAFVAIAALHLPFPLIVLGAALLGMAGGHWLPGHFHAGAMPHGGAARFGPALIDDDTPTPSHARFSWPRLLGTAAVGVALAFLTWLGLALLGGREQPLAQMGVFFSKAALLTFGGAYAVLPYLVQGAVEHYHWISSAQMMDGLALGETTPGPLIMIVAFIGFVGGWSQAAGSAGEHLWLAGIGGALVASWFTFLPSFIFILAGAPVVEASRGNLRLNAPLTAISAAVVGVIASLALFFGHHVFWQESPVPHWDWLAVGIAAAAGVALIKFQMGTIKLLLACAIFGLVLSYLP
ncbi:chromate efflux transporter [Janthinobacterium sp. 1_2014MBL_MicDiv]|uniref:chromate efflux transporter n=1 Tax=Janthinobacterium sp. 1_2014MBL_MicDiv TaxID=1644131 RepID=UPI0008F52A79|nr:chromate efflux transporter [Janthinobacterium sp. 1_2014MBL_MicDiv]APA67209.1 chromate transporter [Janthinobacterium sp. 1_2014MBL_MicDiv]